MTKTDLPIDSQSPHQSALGTNYSKQRCAWVGQHNLLMAHYHDTQWAVPVYDDQHHFEMLSLEGAQAGLNWQTILKKREAYRAVFKAFDPQKAADLTDADLEGILQNEGIIRNRLKVFSVRQNAQVFLKIQEQFGTFNHYIWGFVPERKPIINYWTCASEIPTSTPISILLSKDLKKRGMSFVGPTIMHAYMQAVGLVNDHTTDCWISSCAHL